MIPCRLLDLPPSLFEYNVCQFLDPLCLIRLGSVNHALHDERSLDVHWRSHVCRVFGVQFTPDRHHSLVPLPNSQMQMPSKLVSIDNTSNICWRDVYQVTFLDAYSLRATETDKDALSIYKTHPQILLSQDEIQLRNEIVLMQALRHFPLSKSLITQYAQMIQLSTTISRFT